MVVVTLYGCSESSYDGGRAQSSEVPTAELGAASPAATRYTSTTDVDFSATVRPQGQATLQWTATDAELYEVYRRTLDATLIASRLDSPLLADESLCDDAQVFDDGLGAAAVPPEYEFVGVSTSDAFVDDTVEQPGTYRYMVVSLDGSSGPTVIARDLTISIDRVVAVDPPAAASPAVERAPVGGPDATTNTTPNAAPDAAPDASPVTIPGGTPAAEAAPPVDEVVAPSTGSPFDLVDGGTDERQPPVESTPVRQPTAAQIAAEERLAEAEAALEAAERAAAETAAAEQAAAESAAAERAEAEKLAAEQAAAEEAAAERAAEEQTAAEREAAEQAAAEKAAAELAAAEQEAAEQAAADEAAAELAAAEKLAVEQAAAEKAAAEKEVADTLAAEEAAAERAAEEQAAEEQAAEEKAAEEKAAEEQAAEEKAAADLAAQEQAAAELELTVSECELSPSEKVDVDNGGEGDTGGDEPVFEGELPVVTAELPDTGPANSADDELLAFPGASGHARKVSGGRGGRVVVVDTLDNSIDDNDGRTSLREALTVMEGPRTVTFSVGGVFDTGKDSLVMNGSSGSDLTVACQTAPSPGVIIKGIGMRLTGGANNVIMRHCTIRNVDPGRPLSESSRSISVIGTSTPVNNMIFDHMSLSWSTDENWTAFMGPSAKANSGNFTLSNSIVAEGDADSTHAESGQLPNRYLHAMGPSCNSASTKYRITGCSIISNLIAHNGRRNPLMWGVSGEVINNRIYNWNETALDARPWQNGLLEIQVIGNEFKAGPTSKRGNDPFKVLGSAPDANFQVRGNTSVSYPEKQSSALPDRSAGSPRPASPAGAFDLACVGASRPDRDEIDARIVEEYRTSRGQAGIFENHKRDYSMYSPSSRDPNFDTDRDGMADTWEIGAGLDPGDPSDQRGDLDGDGYTNLEEYINALAACG